MNVKSIKLITNNPDKVKQLENLGISISSRLPIIPVHWEQQSNDAETLGNVDKLTNLSLEEKGEDGEENAEESCSNASTATEQHRHPLREMDRYLIDKIQRMSHLIQIPVHINEE